MEICKLIGAVGNHSKQLCRTTEVLQLRREGRPFKVKAAANTCMAHSSFSNLLKVKVVQNHPDAKNRILLLYGFALTALMLVVITPIPLCFKLHYRVYTSFFNQELISKACEHDHADSGFSLA